MQAPESYNLKQVEDMIRTTGGHPSGWMSARTERPEA